ncbi:MAG: acyl-CoA desaturase [Acidimicrobiales bacterium]|nr:acyl-CoA desaturase [Acidimicrobiales bacterium]
MRDSALGVAPDPWWRSRGDLEGREHVQTTAIEGASGDFRALAVQIRDAGLLDRRPSYYSVKIGLTIAVFAAGWAALVMVGNSWATLGVAAFLAVMFTQVAFVGHDAGHQQIFRSRRANRRLGLTVGNALIGMSFGWWVPKHNAHHAHPNQVDRDPDIGAGGIAFTFDPEATGRRSGAARVVAHWQAWLFFPLLLLQGAGLHVSSIQTLWRRRDRAAALEGLLLVGHAALYLTAVFWVLSPLRALAFIAVQQGLFGLYLGCSFAPNHKGMPIVDRDTDVSFARRQVITARNVTGGRFTTLVLGGLNYQIEHHLFPTMPRSNLAKSQSIIRAFCIESDLGYCEGSLVGSYRQIVRYLRGAAAATALVPRGASGS